MSGYGAVVEWYWQGKSEEIREKPDPVPLCPPQIPYGLTWAGTRACTMRSWWLTTLNMARPTPYVHCTQCLLLLCCWSDNTSHTGMYWVHSWILGLGCIPVGSIKAQSWKQIEWSTSRTYTAENSDGMSKLVGISKLKPQCIFDFYESCSNSLVTSI
jgi:hypothetical protein